MATRYMITTAEGGPLYFRDTRPEADELARAWQADEPVRHVIVVEVEEEA